MNIDLATGIIFALTVIIIFLVFVLFRHGDSKYIEGLQEGQKIETETAIKKAIVEERLALARRLRDNGRRHMPRDGAEPVVVHKAQIGSRRLENPGKPRPLL